MPLIQLLILATWLGLPLIAIWQIATARRRSLERTCPECDQDMTGTAADGPCPACGIIPAISRSRASDPERVICRNCGHDLGGLAWNADCPECGLHSAALPRFRPPPPRHRLRALLAGVLLLVWTLVSTIVVVDWFEEHRYNQARARAPRQAETGDPQAAEGTVPSDSEPRP